MLPLLNVSLPPSNEDSLGIAYPYYSSDPHGGRLGVGLGGRIFHYPQYKVSKNVFSLCSLCAGIPHRGIQGTLIRQLNVPRNTGPGRGGGFRLRTGRRYPVASVRLQRTACDTLLSGLSLTTSRESGLLGQKLASSSVGHLNCGSAPIINVDTLTGRLHSRNCCLTNIPNFFGSGTNS